MHDDADHRPASSEGFDNPFKNPFDDEGLQADTRRQGRRRPHSPQARWERQARAHAASAQTRIVVACVILLFLGICFAIAAVIVLSDGNGLGALGLFVSLLLIAGPIGALRQRRWSVPLLYTFAVFTFGFMPLGTVVSILIFANLKHAKQMYS